MSFITRMKRVFQRWSSLPAKINLLQEGLARVELRQANSLAKNLNESEFRAFSQWGEDGIIQYLISRVPIERKLFVEFGVENYTESNTRFLLTNNYWSGLVIDGDPCNIEYIRKDNIYWACNLKAEHAFIDKDNINNLLTKNGICGDIGLLSVDIDGNDYWIWEAIDCVSPRILVCEYNSHFGKSAKVSVPYAADFVRDNVHFSKIYYGASIAAFEYLSSKKGYSLVGSNMAGNNLFFVRNDLVGQMPVISAAKAYRRAQFREFHDERGALTFDDFETRLDKIGDLQVVDVENKVQIKIKDVKGIISK